MKWYKKLSSGLCILTIALMQAGCQSSMQPLPNGVEPPADLATPCPRLPELSGTTGKVMLPWALEVVHLYNDCAARHDGLIKAWPR